MAPLQIVKDPKIVMRFYSEGRVCVFVYCTFMSNSYHELGWARRAPPIRSISWDHPCIPVLRFHDILLWCLSISKNWNEPTEILPHCRTSPRFSRRTPFPSMKPVAISSYHKWNIAGNSSICRCVWFPSFIEQQFPLLCWIPGGQQTPPVTLDLGSKVLRNMISGNPAGGNLWIFPHVCMQ